MNTTAIVSGIDVKLSRKDMSESVRLWIQKLVSFENPNMNYIFARIMHDNIVSFYTEEGIPFHNEKIKLPTEMHFDEILVGSIYADSQNEDSDFVKLKVTLYANPKEDDKATTELAKFRKEMLRKVQTGIFK